MKKMGYFICAALLRALCLPVAALLYVCAAFSESASSSLLALVVTLEVAKNPDEAIEEFGEDWPCR